MRSGRRIKRNSVFALLSRVVRLLTNFLLFAGIARLYGVEAFGQFTTAHTLATIFLLLADFGFDTLLPTEIAGRGDRASEIARHYFSVKLVLASCASAGMWVLLFFYSMSDPVRVLVRVFSLYVLLASFNNFFFALFKGLEEFQHETRISFVTNAVLLVLLVVLGLTSAPLYLIASAFVGTRAIGLVLALQKASNLLEWGRLKIDLSAWRHTRSLTIVFGLHFVLSSLFFQIDTVILSILKGDHDVGIYQSAFKIAAMALIIPDIAFTTMVPVLSRFFRTDQRQWMYLGRLLHKTLLLLAMPITFVIFLSADDIIHILYGGEGFGDALTLVRIFSLIVFLRFGFIAYALMITTSHRQGVRLGIVGVATVVNVALNLYAIPIYGPWGAAVVSLVTNAGVTIGDIVGSKVPFVEWTLHLRILIPLLVTILLAIGIWEANLTSIWFTLPCAIIVHGFLLYFMGFSEEERALILKGEQGK